MSRVQEELLEDNDRSLQALLAAVPEQYLEAMEKSTVILKREPTEVLINYYNPGLLQLWQANMDIQYVTDPWACAMYILSYISKAEKQMGDLLKQAAKEVMDNDDIRKQLRHVGNAFLSHRDVSAQEAAYRALINSPPEKITPSVVSKHWDAGSA